MLSTYPRGERTTVLLADKVHKINLFGSTICKGVLQGTMSPLAHARVDEKHFEIVAEFFSSTVGESRKLFSSV